METAGMKMPVLENVNLYISKYFPRKYFDALKDKSKTKSTRGTIS